jgi:hypothetical protein
MKAAKRPPPALHKWVRPWLTATGEAMRQLAAETLAAVDRFEAEHYPRPRARRSADRKSREDLVHALVVNLAHSVLSPPPSGRLAIRAGNAAKPSTRHDHPAFGKQVRPLLSITHEMGLLDFHLPIAMRGEVSSIAPTASFAERVRELGIVPADFKHDEREEVLVLTRKVGTRAAPSTDRIDYEDTAETIALRDEVRKLNAFLAAADMDFVHDGLQPHIDPHERGLKRRFVLLKADKKPRWDRAGRLFGDGFWSNLASGRRASIRIDGEAVADLDYASMFARLAYAHIGEAAPEGDLYAIPGLERCYRSGIKLAFNVFMFDSKRVREKWPQGEMGVGVGDDGEAKADPDSKAAQWEGLLPAGWENPERLRTAILAKHPALSKAFGRSLGYGLMFTESRILMAVLTELIGRGIVALPLHDGLLCAQSRKEEAAEVMRTKAKEIAGAAIPVEEKRYDA